MASEFGSFISSGGFGAVRSSGLKIKDSDVKKVSLFWESMGSKVKIMSAEDHDKILSLTSHLPHVIAYNIVKTAMGDDEKTKKNIIRYSAGGLRDLQE